MENVCMIFETDGFYYESTKKYVPREMAAVGVYPIHEKPEHFSFGDDETDLLTLTPREWQGRSYVQRRVHGLSSVPQSTKEQYLPSSDAPDVINCWYHQFKYGERDVVAFKGRNHKSKMLEDLHIPVLDLNEVGCPKFYEIEIRYGHVTSCGLHSWNNYCSKLKAWAFKQWLLKKLYDI